MSIANISGIFVNLPVADLPRSIAFYQALGFGVDRRFTDATAAAIVVSDTIHVMLLTHAKFAEFTPLPIGDAREQSAVLLALSVDGREQVDRLVAAAVAAGGSTFRPPEDHGFMYGHAFRDPDGHVWEPFHMDPSAIPAEQGA